MSNRPIVTAPGYAADCAARIYDAARLLADEVTAAGPVVPPSLRDFYDATLRVARLSAWLAEDRECDPPCIAIEPQLVNPVVAHPRTEARDAGHAAYEATAPVVRIP